MDVVGAFVGVDGFQIHHVANHLVFVGNAVRAVNVAGGACDVQRLAAVVPLQQAHDLMRQTPGVLQAPGPQAAGQREGDFGLHVGQLFLHELGTREGLVELAALECVVPGGVPAELRRAKHAPGNAVTRVVQAAEGALQAAHGGEHRLSGHEEVLQDDLAGDRRAQ